MAVPLPGFRTARLQSWWGVLLMAWLPQVGYAQVDVVDMTPRESDSLFVTMSVGQTRPAHPHDFAEGWEDAQNLRLAFLYLLDEHWGVALALEHTAFNAPTLLFNSEIRLFSIIPSLTWTLPSRRVAPYGRVGLGLLYQGTRRVRIRDGSFNSAGGDLSFSWNLGLALEGNAGVVIPLSREIRPFAEVSYLAGRASSVTLGHLSVRAGVAISLRIFASGVDSGTTGSPQ